MSSRRVRAALLAGMILAACSGSALVRETPALAAPPTKPKDKPKEAPSGSPDVEAAEHLLAKLDYDGANEAADRVVKHHDISHDHLVRAYRVLAVTYAILDKDDRARDAFLQLLVIDPEYTLDPNLGPKVSTPFIEARGQYRSLPSKPGLELVASVRASGGQLRVKTRDPTHVAKKVRVGWRWSSSGDYTTTEVPAGDATVDVGPAPAGRTRLDFYAHANDDRDNELFEVGTPQIPKTAFVEAGGKPRPGGGGGEAKEPSASPPITESPFFWAGAGVVAIGVTILLFTTLGSAEPKAGSASLTPAIRCGPEACR